MKTVYYILVLVIYFFINTNLTKAQNYDYLIITPDVFLENATWDNELLSLQTSRGFFPVIEEVSLGDSREYIQGRIQYYYNTYPLKYVLLMGNGKTVGGIPGTDGGYQWDVEVQGRIVPEVDYLSGTYIPFWDIESNNPFDPSGTSNVASDDPYIEGLTSHGTVYIGRAPVTSVTEADNYVSKLIAYYQQLNSSIYSEAMNSEILLNGDITCNSNSCSGELVTYLNNKLINEHIPISTNIINLKVSEYDYCSTQESWKYCQARQAVFEDRLNQGAAVILILSTTGGPESFGDWYWCSDNRNPLPPHPEINFNLTNKNTGMPFLIAPSCTQGAVHLSNYECTTRKLIVYDNGGIIGAIAPTQGSEQYANGYILNKFNDLIFQDNTPTYGEIFKILKDELASNYPLLEYYYNALTYFGDPSLVPSICKHRSGSIASSATWSGNFVIDATLTVPLGVNLSILPGTKLFFEHLAYFNVKGYLNAVGTSSKKIIFSRLSDNWTTWASIKFENIAEKTPPQSTLDNVNIYNSKGVSCINYDNLIIRNSSFNSIREGIYIYNSAPKIINTTVNTSQYGIYGEANGKSPLIKNNIISRTPNPEHAYAGIYFSNGTNPKITLNDVSGFGYGLYLSGGGYSVFADENNNTPDINNRFRDNSYGIGAANFSRIFAGSSFGTYYCFNSIYDNLYYDADAHTEGYIQAQNNWWGSDGAQLLTYSGGYIDASNQLDYDPWEQIPQNKMTITKELSGNNPVLDSLLIGFILEKEGKIEEAVIHYKQLVLNNFHPRFALARLVAFKYRYQIENIKEYLITLLIGNRPYKPVVLTLLAGILLNENKYEQAMLLFDKIIHDYQNTYLSTNALFEKFFATLYYEKNYVLAEQFLSELQSFGFTDEEFLTRLAIAEQLFDEENEQRLGKYTDQAQNNTENDLPKDYELLGNYPNPFNPTTTISYTLSYHSSVELTIYDIMGREVKSFNIASQTSGYQNIIWDGTNENGNSVSSGVYLYRINIKSLENQEVFIKTSKLMLLK